MEKEIEQLTVAGFTTKQIGENSFEVKSSQTGGTVKRDATAADLKDYLRCIEYLRVSHGRINTFGFRERKSRPKKSLHV
jgi:hypothetical protein